MNKRIFHVFCFVIVLQIMFSFLVSSQETDCFDSDGGKEFLKTGTAAAGNISVTDMCWGDVLNETYCSNGEILVEQYDCMSENRSCGLGRCIGPEDGLCKDSDGGIVYNVMGKVTLGDEREESLCRDDVCMGDVLSESYCNEYGNIDWISHNCSYDNGICRYGRCVSPDSSVCSDSDAGFDFTRKGIAELGSRRIWDYCIDGFLVESLCGEDGNIDWKEYECLYGCYDGACANQTQPITEVSQYEETIISNISSNGTYLDSNTGITLLIDSMADMYEQPVGITVSKNVPGSLVTEDVGDTYLFVNITVSEKMKENINNVKLIVPVSKDWLAKSKTDKEDLVIMWYDMDKGEWQESEINIQSEDNKKIYYTTEDNFLFEIVYVGSSPTEEGVFLELMTWVIVIFVLAFLWFLIIFGRLKQDNTE